MFEAMSSTEASIAMELESDKCFANEGGKLARGVRELANIYIDRYIPAKNEWHC